MKKYYPLIRKLHLYLGLFISPFVLIFSISVMIFNHQDLINRIDPVIALPVIKTKLNKPPSHGSDLETAMAIKKELNIKGDIDFISKNDSIISFPVNKPGLFTRIKANTNTGDVTINRRYEGFLRAMTYLHSMPGPHNVKIRGNSIFMKVWRGMADVVVYILLFLTVSGVFLWYIFQNERVVGIYALVAGAAIFTMILLLIF